MSDQDQSSYADLLAEHPFVEGLDETQIAQIAGCVESIVKLDPDEVIFRAGGTANRLYLLRHGDVALEVHSPGVGARIVQTLHGGEVLGWSWMFAPYRWAFDARALTPTEALVLDGKHVRECAGADPEMGLILMTRLARLIVDRLQATRLQLLDMYASRD
jgi:CRP-like cAMP-binding protein